VCIITVIISAYLLAAGITNEHQQAAKTGLLCLAIWAATGLMLLLATAVLRDTRGTAALQSEDEPHSSVDPVNPRGRPDGGRCARPRPALPAVLPEISRTSGSDSPSGWLRRLPGGGARRRP